MYQAVTCRESGSRRTKEVTMGAVNHVENRWSQRRPLNVSVDVMVGNAKLASCRTKDVGLGGVFLYLDEDVQPDKDVDLELYFVVSDKPKQKLRGRVVRNTQDGIGLIFRDFDTGSFRALQEIMRQVPSLN